MKSKLIRNKLALIPKEGVRVLNTAPGGAFHRAMLAGKLHEEAAEIAEEPGDVNEYADLFEVALQLAHYNGITEAAIFSAMLAKRHEKGGFGDGAIMVRE